jgi:putative transposase
MTIRGNHHITDLKVHLVFVVKYRKKLISPSVKSILTQSFEETCKKLDCRLLECNGEEDHIHLLIEYLPTIPISVLVHRSIKPIFISIMALPQVIQVRSKI